MNHSSPILSCVAKVSIKNPLPICSANNVQMLSECDTTYDTGRACQVGFSNATSVNMNVLLEMT